MKKKLAVWRLIKDSLAQKIPVMLLFVLESKGSSPGRQGFLMAVTADGKMEGSIGGGIMEHKFVEMAKEKLQIKNSKSQIRKQIHDKSAAKNQSGMICSGEQTVLIYSIQGKDIAPIEQIISCLEKNENATLQLTPDGVGFVNEIPLQACSFSMKNESDWEYEEKLGYQNHLYIIGGGHCALALSKLMSTMDFYIHVFDDRENLLTMNQNEFAQEKKLVSYSELASFIPSGNNNYVVVMTFGYRTDDIVMRALIGKDFKYFGLLGSRKKISKMFCDYLKEGIEDSFIGKVNAPIGIQIKSETPEEIAVSIAAAIISIKNDPAAWYNGETKSI